MPSYHSPFKRIFCWVPPPGSRATGRWRCKKSEGRCERSLFPFTGLGVFWGAPLFTRSYFMRCWFLVQDEWHGSTANSGVLWTRTMRQDPGTTLVSWLQGFQLLVFLFLHLVSKSIPAHSSPVRTAVSVHVSSYQTSGCFRYPSFCVALHVPVVRHMFRREFRWGKIEEDHHMTYAACFYCGLFGIQGGHKSTPKQTLFPAVLV